MSEIRIGAVAAEVLYSVDAIRVGAVAVEVLYQHADVVKVPAVAAEVLYSYVEGEVQVGAVAAEILYESPQDPGPAPDIDFLVATGEWGVSTRSECWYTDGGWTGTVGTLHRRTDGSAPTLRLGLPLEFVGTLTRDVAGDAGAVDTTGALAGTVGVHGGVWYRQLYYIDYRWARGAHRCYWRNMQHILAKWGHTVIGASGYETSPRPWIARIAAPGGSTAGAYWQASLAPPLGVWMTNAAHWTAASGKYAELRFATHGKDIWHESVELSRRANSWFVLDCDWAAARIENVEGRPYDPQIEPDPVSHAQGQSFGFFLDPAFPLSLLGTGGD